MWNIFKRIRNTDSETPERTEEEVVEGVFPKGDLGESVLAEEALSEDAAEHPESVVGNVADKVKGMAEGTARIAKTAGGATARGVTTAWEIAGIGLKSGGAVAGQGARSAGSHLKTAGGAVAGAATEVGAKAWDAIDDKVESCWAVVRETFIETAGGAIQSAVENDATMERIFKTVYFALPADMRRWVSEEQFISFCLKNRDRLIGAALQAPAQPVAPALPEQNDTRVVDI